MSNQKETRGFRDEFEAGLNSPFTLLMKLRNFVFGEEKPDIYTRISFFIGIFGWFTFFTWSILGTFAIKMREVIVDKKEIDVISLLEARGKELKFEPGEFLKAIENFYLISILLWALAFAGLVMLYRKKFTFVYFFFGGTIGYILLMWILLGFEYFRSDTTTFDKVVLFVIIGHTSIYAYVLSQQLKGIPISLFGVDPEETDK